ncbi:PA14 domain-containing protein [Polaribacter sp. IC073]|uniref:PA14 domain-containing protein n=1 Tax=Polaribacter sp. IC073 TaxID=2508540 RepID=UPI0011BED699|nr:PA14 domain-containing protein [Polaribacter sp. IC073]TXD47631.1 T9SS type A sorting domain-containing protein [Polaribacter sp. IC073]
MIKYVKETKISGGILRFNLHTQLILFLFLGLFISFSTAAQSSIDWSTASWTNGNTTGTIPLTVPAGYKAESVTISVTHNAADGVLLNRVFDDDSPNIDYATNGSFGGIDDFGINFNPAYFRQNANSPVTIKLTFSSPIKNLVFNVSDVDYSNGRIDRVYVTSNAGDPASITRVNTSNSTIATISNNNTITSSAAKGDSTNDNLGSALVNFGSKVIEEVTITYSDSGETYRARGIGLFGAFTVSSPATINAITDNGGAINENIGGVAVKNVRSNDIFKNTTATNNNTVLTSVNSTHPGITLDTSTGAVNVSAAVPAGNYTLKYKICESSLVTNCSTATVTIPVIKKLDSDGDGVLDATDLDSDNDGILDRAPCGNIDIFGNFGTNTSLSASNNGNKTISGGTANFTFSKNGTSLETRNLNASGQQGPIFYFNGNSGDNASINTTFSPNIHSVQFKLADFDEDEIATVTIYDENNALINLTGKPGITVGSQITQSGANGQIFTTNSGASDTSGDFVSSDAVGSVLFNLGDQVVSRVSVKIEHTTGSSIRYTEIKYCVGALVPNEGRCTPTPIAGNNGFSASQIIAKVKDPDKAIDGISGNGKGAKLEDDNATMEVVLRSGSEAVAAGTVISIEAKTKKLSANNVMFVTESTDGTTFVNEQPFTFATKDKYDTKRYTLSTNATHLRIRYQLDDDKLEIDNVSYPDFKAPCFTSRDTDKDGVPDYLDLDSDNDGIPDVIEAGGIDNNHDGLADGSQGGSGATIGVPASAGTGLTPPDTDGDGIYDYLDIDSDNDGIPDNIEAQTSAGYIAPSGVGTAMTDTNNNGLDDNYEANGTVGFVPVNTDSTNDIIPDYLDLDSDNDGIPDIKENGDFSNIASGKDTDGDGLDDAFDDNDDSANAGYTVNDGVGLGNKVTDAASLKAAFGDEDNNFAPGAGDVDYRDFKDVDNDGVADFYDIDDDNDGILDTTENLLCNETLNYEFYDRVPSGNTVDNIPTTGADGVGNVSNFEVTFLQNIVTPKDDETYSIRYFGYIDIAVTDTYTFYLNSDDGSKLFIDGNEVVDYDGLHGAGGFVSGTPTLLDSGLHEIVVLFFERTGGHSLNVQYSNSSFNRRDVPFSILSPVTCDNDGDGIPNQFDLDSDNDGIPDNIEAQATVGYTAPAGVDADLDGLDDAYDTTPNGTVDGAGSLGIIPINTDAIAAVGSDTVPDYLDLDADADGIFDIIESGSGLTDTAGGADGRTDGDVGANGLDNTLDNGDNYVDVNGSFDDTQADNFTDSDGDVLTIGDVDYRDATDDGIPMITQTYQLGDEKWIEVTNIHATKSIAANLIKVQLYATLGNKTGIPPTTTFTFNDILPAGESILFRNSANKTVTNYDASEVTRVITDDALTNLAGANDMITLSSKNDILSYEYRYDVIEAFADKTSYVRIDETLVPSKTYTTSEWIVFIDDALNPYSYLTGTAERHPHAPLISEIEGSNTDANTYLGLHRVAKTERTGSGWNNGYPDRSRYVVISENYEHTGANFSARKLEVKDSNILSIDNQLLVVTNNINIATDAEIRMIGKSQLIQTHTGPADISGNGKLYIEQKSDLENVYRYNYMSSPVTSLGATTYSVESVLKDGTNPVSHNGVVGQSATDIARDINFIGGYDGSTGTPINIAEHWIYTFASAMGNRAGYIQKFKSGTIAAADGFIFKGPGVTQNYTFVGNPNDGNYETEIGPNDSYLIGNPFPSALNGVKFLKDNLSSIDGSLYFWDHVGEEDTASNTSGHNYKGYVGGYATLNLSMAVSATSSAVSVGAFSITLEAENTINTGSLITDADKKLVRLITDGAFIDFNSITRATDVIYVNYKSASGKTLRLIVNGNSVGSYDLPASANYTQFTINKCLTVGTTIKLESIDTNRIDIDNIVMSDDDGDISCAPSTGTDSSKYKTPGSYIPVGQGFFIGTNINGGPIVFNNSQREYKTTETSESVFFKSTKKTKDEVQNKDDANRLPLLKLGMDFISDNGTSLHRQIGVSFSPNNTFNYEKGYDSEIYDLGATDMYWKFATSESKYTIAGIEAFSDQLEIPFEITMNYTGTIILTIDDTNKLNNNIYIKDKLQNKTSLITDNKVALQLNQGKYSDRFAIVFKEEKVLATEDFNNPLNTEILVFLDKDNNELVIENKNNLHIEKVVLFNLLGQKTKSWNTIEPQVENRLKVKNLANAVYIVNIKTTKGIISKKVLYHK